MTMTSDTANPSAAAANTATITTSTACNSSPPLFGREFCPKSRRPPYFAAGSGLGAHGGGGGPASVHGGGGPHGGGRRGGRRSFVLGGGGSAHGQQQLAQESSSQTASALGLDLLEAAVAARGGAGGQGGGGGGGGVGGGPAVLVGPGGGAAAGGQQQGSTVGAATSTGASSEADAAGGGGGGAGLGGDASPAATAGGVQRAPQQQPQSRRSSLGNLLFSPFSASATATTSATATITGTAAGAGGQIVDDGIGGESTPRMGRYQPQQQMQQQQQQLQPTASPPRAATSSYGYFTSPGGAAGTAGGPPPLSSPLSANRLLAPLSANRLSGGQLQPHPLASSPGANLAGNAAAANNDIVPTWRLKERMKTVGVGMVLALNIGTDPPDVQKPNPCAKLQCWIDPTTMSRAKARERIGEKLETQYARWQQRAKLRYKRALDPTVEDVRGLCVTMRRQAKNERLLLHYNGHGVPRPTVDGEIYVFDKNHTHFIPLSVLELRRWIGKPTIVVLDCSGAGVLMPYLTGALEHYAQLQQQQASSPSGAFPSATALDATGSALSPSIVPATPPQGRRSFVGSMDALAGGSSGGRLVGESESAYAARTVRDTIVLCPTSPGDLLPMGPEFPADLFTSCLTTPIPIALRWFVHQNPLSRASLLDPSRVDSIPGKINDRKTPLGELNWIFTAITDTIAWNVLPSPLFQRLFRQDLIVASMFRNFLLADRILRNLNCTPMSHPTLPPTHDHPLWQGWDLAVETCLDQLMRDGVLANSEVPPVPASVSDGDGVETEDGGNGDGAGEDQRQQHRQAAAAATAVSPPSSTPKKQSLTAPFFAEQLTAFEIWLEFASLRLQGNNSIQVLRFGDPSANGDTSDEYFYMEPPEQLPVVLQVLLSQAHRVRALALLRRFLGLGNAAVNLALSVGIFPYVLKLLQSSIDEYKHVLVGIWAKILLFDASCQADLVKDGALPHFIRHLHWGLPDAATATSPNGSPPPPISSDEAAEQRTMAAVILSSICADYPPGQKECLGKNLHGVCASLLSSVEYLDTIEGIGAQGGSERRGSISEERLPAKFRLWLCLCLGNVTKDNAMYAVVLYKSGVHLRLIARLNDDSPDVRAGACYSLGCLIGSAPGNDPDDDALRPKNAEASMTMPPGSQTAAQAVPGLTPSFLPPPGVGLPLQVGTGLNLSSLQPQLQPQQQGMQPQPPFHQQMTYDPAQQIPLGPGLMPAPILGATGAYPAGIPSQPMAPFQLHQGQQQPIEQEQQRRHKPSVYDDQRRLDYDLEGAEKLATTAKEDGSPTVRYEALLSLSGFVGKYLKAFVAVADEGLTGSGGVEDRPSSLEQQPLRDNQLATIPDEGDENADDDTESGGQKIPLPRGVNSIQARKFGGLWKTLHSLQHEEPYEHASFVASSVVSAVNENLFVLRTRLAEEETNQLEDQPNFLGANASTSDPSAATATQASSATGVSNPPVDLGAITPPTLPLRRNQSDAIVPSTSEDFPTDRTKSRSTHNMRASRRWSNDFEVQYKPPPSRFYEWKRSEFGKSLTPQVPSTLPLLDPLSHDGAVQIYRERRNLALHEESESLSEEFACLAPKPKQPKKRSMYGGAAELDLLNAGLDGASAKAAAAFEEEVASKKQALHLGQSAMLLNKDKKMTSMLKFHAYEPALVVSDGGNTVSLWDVNTAKRINSFRNGHNKSRNTSMTWINEMTSSLLLMGTDDGTVRIYDGLVEDSGGIAHSTPELASAFVAAPDLDVGKRGGSGLVTEWQQFSGRLLAGGSSKTIHCWDLESEKCRASFESNLSSCVTTITTAWDYTSSDLQSRAGGYSGIGPDIFVAGYGNGALKVFDIRAKLEPVSEGSTGSSVDFRGNSPRRSRRPPKLMQYTEHTSWIVNTAFTSFGGRYEIVSGCVAGDIRFWDLRIPESIRTLDVQRSPMTALACHPGIPFFATGSHAQFIKILSMDGDTLQVIRYHEEIAGQRMGPVSCLAFHPHRPLLAAGATDEIVSLYSPK